MKLDALALICAALFPCTALAFGPAGHMAIGSIADELLKGSHAATESRKILGSNLRTASVWADCAKGVETKHFKYGGAGEYAECAIYETDRSRPLMEAFVKRNVGTCPMPPNSDVCHKQYHYTDVSIQRDNYALGVVGTSDHDVVAAINATIAVLQGQPSPAPFHIVSKKEALRLLAHYVGDVHQPLHVGSVYLDAAGSVIDPDQGDFNPNTETTGGNDLLLERPGGRWKPRKLHSVWDSVTGSVLNLPVSKAVLQRAEEVPETTGAIMDWSAKWATESLLASKSAFKDLNYEPLDQKAKLYLVTLPPEYNIEKNAVQRERVVLAGARLAQILKTIWP